MEIRERQVSARRRWAMIVPGERRLWSRLSRLYCREVAAALTTFHSTTSIVEKSILLAQNGIVTVRAQEESYPAVLRTTPFRGQTYPTQASIRRPHLTVLRTPILIWCNFFPKHSFSW